MGFICPTQLCPPQTHPFATPVCEGEIIGYTHIIKARKLILYWYRLYWRNISYWPLISTNIPPKCIEKIPDCTALYRPILAGTIKKIIEKNY